MVANRPS